MPVEREKKFNRFLPQWVGAPKDLVKKANTGLYTALCDWVGDVDVDEKMLNIGESYIAARKTGKFRFGDFYRFKKRYYDVLIPCFDSIENAYKKEMERVTRRFDELCKDEKYNDDFCKGYLEKRKNELFTIYTANILAVQKCLDYVDFFFWREIVKFGKTPSDLKISYKPRVAVADFECL